MTMMTTRLPLHLLLLMLMVMIMIISDNVDASASDAAADNDNDDDDAKDVNTLKSPQKKCSLFSSFFDLTIGITDPTVFNVPRECQ
jgi:hypothetical protein